MHGKVQGNSSNAKAAARGSPEANKGLGIMIIVTTNWDRGDRGYWNRISRSSCHRSLRRISHSAAAGFFWGRQGLPKAWRPSDLGSGRPGRWSWDPDMLCPPREWHGAAASFIPHHRSQPQIRSDLLYWFDCTDDDRLADSGYLYGTKDS